MIQQVKNRHQWAADFNDRSPNENHHCSAGLALLKEMNFMYGLSEYDQAKIRRLVVEMVSAHSSQHEEREREMEGDWGWRMIKKEDRLKYLQAHMLIVSDFMREKQGNGEIQMMGERGGCEEEKVRKRGRRRKSKRGADKRRKRERKRER